MPQKKPRTTLRFIALASVFFAVAGGPYALFAATGITAPNVTVGRNLEMYTSVRLPQPAPESGVQLTLTSDDPSRLLLSAAPDKAGSATLSLTVRPHLSESPEFWVQGLADSGEATYTISAADMGSAKGTVTLTPSADLDSRAVQSAGLPDDAARQPDSSYHSFRGPRFISKGCG